VARRPATANALTLSTDKLGTNPPDLHLPPQTRHHQTLLASSLSLVTPKATGPGKAAITVTTPGGTSTTATTYTYT
jgi:hypothetical protein